MKLSLLDIRDQLAVLPHSSLECFRLRVGTRKEPDMISGFWFNPEVCSIYSSRYRFCFETTSKREFTADVDICVKKLPFYKALQQHRKRHLQEAFRFAVKDQIEKLKTQHFLDKPVRVCELTGDLFSIDTCHADHGGPREKSTPYLSLSFSKLMQNFHKEEKRIYNSFLTDVQLTQTPPYHFLSAEVKNRWQTFHAEYAILHIVSRKANLYLCR
jgi:hypothetical protein